MKVKKMCFANIINFFKDKNQCLVNLEQCEKSNEVLEIEHEDLQKKYDDLYNTWEILNDSIPKNDPLIDYWDNKRPKSDDYRYKGRAIWGQTVNTGVDPRIFYTPVDNLIPVVDGTNDEKSMKALQWVIDHIIYVTDTTNFKKEEEWLLPFETMTIKTGDCEDGAILLANIMLKSGIPYWRIRLNAGDVKGGGHCWCTYLRESDNQWTILDWCFYPEDALKGLLYKDAENYYDIWFSFSTKYIYINENFER
jgi:predicted transglutaminase-like cysteine proteinase